MGGGGGEGGRRTLKIQTPLKVGHYRPTSETPFKLCFVGGTMMAQHWQAWYLVIFQGIRTSIAKKPQGCIVPAL